MRPKAVFLALAALVLVGTSAVVGVNLWKKSAIESRARETLATGTRLLAEGKADEARTIFRTTKAPAPDSDLAGPWFDLEVRIAAANRQWQKLRRLQKSNPQRFAAIPEASAWLERLDYLSRPDGAAPALTATSPLLRADELLSAGDTEGARRLLESTTLEGPAEVNRLARLALLAADDEAKAWELLNRAYAIDDMNPDIRTFAGNLLEKDGQADRARAEYVAAFLAAPENPRVRDNLAEFYIRQGLVALAIDTWKTAEITPANAALLLKAWFWNRVVFGGPSPVPEGMDTGLPAALAKLPPTHFWSAELESIVGANPSASDRQELFWLRALEFLRTGEDEKAWAFLSGSEPALAARHPFLRESLIAVLGARTGESVGKFEIPAFRREGHPFWEWLAGNLGNAEALKAPWVLPTLLAVSGWMRAGLDMGTPAEIAAGAPDWALYTLAQAARICGDDGACRTFVAAGPEDYGPLAILRAQLAWADGDSETGRRILEGLLGQPETGYRAAALLGLYYLDRGELNDVTRVLAAQPDFAESVPGREILARVHLLRDEEAAAAALYEGMVESSDEAAIFLARKAFVGRDWDRAAELTRLLADRHPAEPQFRKNLEAIAAASAGGQ